MKLTCRLYQQTLSRLGFVPRSKDVSMSEVQQLQEFVLRTKRLLVITGAGLSTESGIPDYRSEGVGLYARTDRRPMQFQEFLKSKLGRQRYWARNFVGWPAFSSFQPNPGHKALSEWEQRGFIKWLVTQNVDALHTKAGSKNITELHGCSHRVVCLNCPKTMERWDLQKIFAKLNPNFNETTVEIAPDGDVQLTEDQIKDFQIPDCPGCGGILKPDVIFFGDNVPRPKVDQVFGYVDECDSILVAGSSLFLGAYCNRTRCKRDPVKMVNVSVLVYSGFRFIQRAAEQGKEIAIVNIGPTRGDKLANLKIDARCEILPLINLDGLLT